MAVSFETYKQATEAVKSGKAPDDVLGGLMDIIDEWEKGHQEGYAPGAFDVPTAAQMEEKKARELPPGAFDVPTAEQMAKREGEARALNAPVTKALKLREGMSGGMSGAPSHLAQEPPKPYEVPGEFKGGNYDENLPTASHRKDEMFVAPPEYIPPKKAPPLDFWGSLNEAQRLLPSHLGEGFGGEAQHFYEPPLAQFKRDMAPVYGSKVNGMDEFSPEYQEYSDKLWKDIYDQAVAKGQPVVRVKYAKGNNLLDKVSYGVSEHVLGPLAAGVFGASEALPFNPAARAAPALGSSKENVERLKETFPTAKDVGFGLGAAAPISTGNLALKGAGALAPEIGALSKVPAIVQRVAKNAASGYISGGAQQLGSDLEKGNTEGSLGRANQAGLYGAPLSILGGELAAGMQRESAALRKESPLGSIPSEEYGKTSITSGFKAGPRTEALREEARAVQAGPANAPDVESALAGRLEKPLVEEGRRLRGTEEARVGAELEKFHNMNAGELRSPEKYVGTLSELHKKVTDRNGAPLPENGQIASQIRKKLADVVDVEFVPRTRTPEDLDFAQRLSRRQAEEEARAQELHEPRPDPFPMQNPERTNPGGRAIEGEPTTPDEVTPIGLNDLEFPPGTTLPPPAELRTRLRGPGLSRLKEIQKETPSAFMVPSATQAVKEGFITPEEAASVGDQYDIVVVPKKFSPGEFHQIVAGVNVANREGSAAQPDPRLVQGTARSIREDRDLFTGSSPEIPRSLQYTIKDEQGNPIPLRGYSAYEAMQSDKLGELKRKLTLAGVGENPPELLPGSPYRGFVGNARGYGASGRPPEVDQSLRELAASAAEHGHPEAPKTLEEIKIARAVAELEKAARITQMFRGYGGVVNPVERMSAMGLRLRLDPLLQFAAPKLGGLGAAGAVIPQRQERGALPPTAPQATIDQISNLLGFGP